MKFSIKDFFSKCDQIRKKSHKLKQTGSWKLLVAAEVGALKQFATFSGKHQQRSPCW